MSEEKEKLFRRKKFQKKKGVQKKKMIDTPYKRYVNTVVEEHFSSENRHSGIIIQEAA